MPSPRPATLFQIGVCDPAKNRHSPISDAILLFTRNVGPKAFQALSSSGIKIFTGEFKSGMEFIEKFRKGELRIVNSPTVPVNNNLERENMRKIGGE